MSVVKTNNRGRYKKSKTTPIYPSTGGNINILINTLPQISVIYTQTYLYFAMNLYIMGIFPCQ